MATRLILVEDVQQVRLPIVKALTAAGYEVDACPGFSMALRQLQNATNDVPDYAALLTDYYLGEGPFTGLSVCQAIKRTSNRKIPIIASSGEMKYWEEVQDVFKLHLVPKVDHLWDAPAILAKLHNLGITP